MIGVLTALVWIGSEQLINELSAERFRGRVVGIYSSVGAAGFALGPLLLVLTGSEGMLPFYATAAMVLLATAPLLLVETRKAIPGDAGGPGLWAVFWMAPVVMLVNVVYAASAESMITFFPLFGMHLGLSEEYALSLMTVIAVGGMILILPLGWLADHVNRMGMLASCVALTALGLLVMPGMLGSQAWVAVTFMFLLGGIEGMLYALGVTLIGQRFKGAILATATTAFTTCWGVGTIIGPMISGIGMDRFGAGSLAWIAAAFFIIFLPFPVVAWLRDK